MILACGISCISKESPQASYDHAYQTFLHGNLKQSQEEAYQGCERFQGSNPEWAWKFRILEAESVLWRGMYADALTTIDAPPTPADNKNSLIEALAIEGAAHARLHEFAVAEERLDRATKICETSMQATCGDVIRAHGSLAVQRGQIEAAERFFEESLRFARAHGDRFLEETALLNLGFVSMREGHFDEAIDRTNGAYQAATALGARGEAQAALGNLGWAYYNLGDSERSLQLSLEAEKGANQVGNVADQLSWITDAGYVYAGIGDLVGARTSYLTALDLATKINGKQSIYNALRALALVSAQSGDLIEGRTYSDKAITMAKAENNRPNELYPLLVKGLIAARSHDGPQAEQIFREVERDPSGNPALKWRSEHALAQLYEDEKRPDAAEREYRAALTTFEAARSSLHRNDSKLPFSNNAARIYDDYIHFLISQKRPDYALRWADYSRARTLAEGLGLLTKESLTATSKLNPQKIPAQKDASQQIAPQQIAPRQIAKSSGGTILFYWLGEKQSYLWTITPQKSILSTLPPGKEINAAVERYRKALGGPQDVLASANPDGRWLYRTLIAPAQTSLNLKKDAKVFIIPDGSLNNLNFETLIVSEPVPEAKMSDPNSLEMKPHFWIEDVTISNASSLRVLGAASAGKSNETANNKNNNKKDRRSLLLVGNSIAPNDKYPELPKAATQMASVARHFPESTRTILGREQATPGAYLSSNPERYSYIHFVAHGTASRLSPLDSAIVLSRSGKSAFDGSAKSPSSQSLAASSFLPQAQSPKASSPAVTRLAGEPENDSFKLYARDIIGHPLHADLVTISACYGAGDRAYSGEGLVGLSWAFLRAGAHNVIAALWEATDASTDVLMDKFYDEIDKGSSPDAALRSAKLALLHGGAFRNPFYWAPFQLYTGS